MDRKNEVLLLIEGFGKHRFERTMAAQASGLLRKMASAVGTFSRKANNNSVAK
jgi:hypothetical protein